VPRGPGAPQQPQDDDGNIHELAIDCMVWWEIAKGTSATTYEPATRSRGADGVVRRPAHRAERRRAAGRRADAFSDDNGLVHEASINRLAAAGLVKGTAEGRYSPDAPVSRGQMATFLVRAYEHVSDDDLSASSDYFSDDDGSTHEDNINKSAEAGFTNGRDGGYQPADVVRRDAMASFLSRALDLLVEEGTTPPHE
jgi:hypothetical protein